MFSFDHLGLPSRLSATGVLQTLRAMRWPPLRRPACWLSSCHASGLMACCPPAAAAPAVCHRSLLVGPRPITTHTPRFKSTTLARLGPASAPGTTSRPGSSWRTAGIPRLYQTRPDLFPVTDRSFFTWMDGPCDRYRSLQCSNLIVAFVSAPRTDPTPALPPCPSIFHIRPNLVRVCFDLPLIWPLDRCEEKRHPWMSDPNSRLNSPSLVSFLLFPQYAMRHCPSRSFNSTTYTYFYVYKPLMSTT